MPTEIICALISTAGVLLSAVISRFVSRAAAKKETEKLRLIWEREDVVSSDEDFAKMAAVVAEFVASGYNGQHKNAMSKVAAIRSKESGEIAAALDRLYEALTRRDLHGVDSSLSRVIEEKRKAKR
jgi:hypothetical protein